MSDLPANSDPLPMPWDAKSPLEILTGKLSASSSEWIIWWMAQTLCRYLLLPTHRFSRPSLRESKAAQKIALRWSVTQSGRDPQMPVFSVKTMERRLEDALARPQFYSTAVLSFAVFALLLAVIGIYGIVAYTVGQRTHEMGIRMALGTTPVRLRANLLRQSLITIAAGAIPGIAGAIFIGRFLESLVEGAKSVDAPTCATSVLFIALIASVGIWVATRPVAQLDIMEVLRAE